MGVAFTAAKTALGAAVVQLYQSDARVRSVGICRHEAGYGFLVIRNTARSVPLVATIGPPLLRVRNVPVIYHDRQADPQPHVKLPARGPGSPTSASLVPEQSKQSPLVCGLQIQNFDNDTRTGTIASGHIAVGTLGCFVSLGTGGTAILSNNHVMAGENHGVRGSDRIAQPGAGAFSSADHVATLTDYVDIRTSPAGATPAAGNVDYNDVDAGIAALKAGVAFHQAYLSSRALAAPCGQATVSVGDPVFKVGRTTGLTRGTVTAVAAVVGPIQYTPGPCWFRGSIILNGVKGSPFSEHGDSGAALIKEATGEVVGLVFAGNGSDAFACPIDAVLAALSCTIA